MTMMMIEGGGGGGGGGISKAVAVWACTAMTLLYVGVLYAPTVVLRLPPPSSFTHYLLRRFSCAAVSSVASFAFSVFILFRPVRSCDVKILFGTYGMRTDHLWQAVVFPLSLTSLMYAGSFVFKSLLLLNSWKEYKNHGGSISLDCIKIFSKKLSNRFCSVASNIKAWRNYVVAPITEELVFRACMIPLLISGGFDKYKIIFLTPLFFSLAHLNHIFEIYWQQNCNWLRTFMVLGLQLGYTVVFGSYATFLFVRTGNLLAPVVVHIFCNIMGLPVLFSGRNGIITMASVAGVVGFLWRLFPLTHPELYNGRADDCRYWHAYCLWN